VSSTSATSRGHRVLRISRKGGRDALEPLPSNASWTPTSAIAAATHASSTITAAA
jgi:hypothetical protein